MSIYRKLSSVVCAGLLMVGLGGCEQEGPAERAGEKIDEAAEGLSKAEGPAERAGKKVDKAAEDAGEALEEAGDRVREAVK